METHRRGLYKSNTGFYWKGILLLTIFLAVNGPRYKANHSPPSTAEGQECVEPYLQSPYVFMAWCLFKHRGDSANVNETKHRAVYAQ